MMLVTFFFQAEDGIRDGHVTGVQTCALPICFKITKERYHNVPYIMLGFSLGSFLLRSFLIKYQIGRASCRERV